MKIRVHVRKFFAYASEWKRFSPAPTLPGFTLIELSIVMIIIGIIMAGVFKGQDLIESARLQSTLSELNRLKMAALQYRDQYGAWPGNDSKALARFGEGVTSGDGTGVIKATEASQVWIHLSKAGLLDSADVPTTKVGGFLSIQGKPRDDLSGTWIVLAGESATQKPALTPKQAMILKSKMDEPAPSKGKLRVVDGHGADGKCVKGDGYHMDTETQACVIMLRID